MKRLSTTPLFSPRRCTACGRCVRACPREAIRIVGFLWHRHAKPDPTKCVGCNLCVRICPHGCFEKHSAG